jgi:hypothetical protein
VGLREGGAGSDLTGKKSGLLCVVFANPAGHEEGVHQSGDCRDDCPREAKIEDAEAFAADVELVDSNAAEKDGQQDADNFVSAGVLIFGEEPGELLKSHVGGVDRIYELHVVEAPGTLSIAMERKGIRGSGGASSDGLQFAVNLLTVNYRLTGPGDLLH